MYFRDRASHLEVAAVSFAAKSRGKRLCSDSQAQLRALLRSPRARVYGAQRFDGGAREPAPHWAPFEGFLFVLPAVELVRVDAQANAILAANLLRREDVAALQCTLRGITAAPRVLRAPAALMLPRACDVEHIVSYDAWAQRMRIVLSQLQSRAYEKIVLARAKRFRFAAPARHEPLRILAALDDANRARRGAGSVVSASYLFCLQLQPDVAFLGCSPERLFHVHGAQIHTVAVAGTVRRDQDEGRGHELMHELWGPKNVREHNFVIQHITSALQALGACASVGETDVLPLPRLMHLVTPISGSLPDAAETAALVFKLLQRMHPTPAVCGMPRQRTLDELSKLEQFDRGLYSGPFGWFSQEESEFCVAIRSALVTGDSVIAYAGSGIVDGSVSRSEWEETELKMSAFTDLFIGDISLLTRMSRISGSPKRTAAVLQNGTHVNESQVQTFDCTALSQEHNLNSLWGGIVVEELCRNGVNTFFIAPGSRSAPLAVAVVRCAHARLIVVHDERSAAFMAVGYARGCGRAAAVITSSGTAVANLLPAVVEAYMDNVPMILLTADRPPELRDIGANQCIDQVGIFGSYTRYNVDVPCPTETVPLRKILSDIDHAVFISGSLPIAHVETDPCVECGPVHLNFMFRENLAPDPQSWNRAYLATIPKRWTQSVHPLCVSHVGVSRSVSLVDTHESGAGSMGPFYELDPKFPGVIVVGGGVGAPRGEEDKLFITFLAEQLGWPVFADVASGLRLQAMNGSNLVSFMDQILTSHSAEALTKFRVILQFGERLVSKRVLKLIARCSNVAHFTHIIVSPRSKRSDQVLSVTHRVLASPVQFVAHWCSLQNLPFNCFLPVASSTPSHENDTSALRPSKRISSLECLLNISAKVDHLFESKCIAAADSPICEPWLARTMIDTLRYPCALFVGNSMPIRDTDMYASPIACGASIHIGANRGASGIDGIVSSAIGFAVAHCKPTFVLIGDMSFLHDISAVHVLRGGVGMQDVCAAVTIVVVNNGGGAIFSMLPIANHHQVFTPVFDSPHDLSFRALANFFRLDYVMVKTSNQLRGAIDTVPNRHRIIEVVTTSQHSDNAALHSELANQVDLLVKSCIQDDYNLTTEDIDARSSL